MTRSHSSGYELRRSGIAETGERDGAGRRKLIFGAFNRTSDVTGSSPGSCPPTLDASQSVRTTTSLSCVSPDERSPRRPCNKSRQRRRGDHLLAWLHLIHLPQITRVHMPLETP